MLQFYLSMVEAPDERNLISDLYTKHEQKMYATAFGVLHNAHSAEDAVHEAFLKIIKNIHKLTFENEKKTAALVSIIVKNIALDMLKKNKRSEIEEELDESIEDESAYAEYKKVEETAAFDVINKLSDELRQTIIMRYVLDIDAETVADSMGISTATVYARIRKARKIMRSALEKDYGISKY